MRVRGFTQDDAHIFCTHEQLADECLKINELILSIYRDFGFEEVVVKLSTRPEKRVGADELWDQAEADMTAVLKQIAAQSGGKIKTGINPGEGAFYGPKFEYVLRDAIGRDWQCGTTQVDFNLPGRFGAFYIDADGEKKTPVMIHRAIFGSLERFTGVLIENFAGHFPLWLAPVQMKVLPVMTDVLPYAKSVADRLEKAGFRVEVDERQEKIGAMIRDGALEKIPYLLVVGAREKEGGTVAVRDHKSGDQGAIALDAFIMKAQEQIARRE
jgi:threonyl-tRNA synthetase